MESKFIIIVRKREMVRTDDKEHPGYRFSSYCTYSKQWQGICYLTNKFQLLKFYNRTNQIVPNKLFIRKHYVDALYKERSHLCDQKRQQK